MPIHILPPEVASQIAAGEVVERPASVVKELLENALDAGATQITIRVEDAGQRLIEVSDDGGGIPAAELSLAIERHATSKLESAADLFHIDTLGFRGEALASIGSVARLTITSRAADSPVGAQIRVEGGLAEEPQPLGAPNGTVVRVENLFFNVPARRKFLKTAGTERRQIDKLVTFYALAYSSVRFRLEQEGRIALQTSGSGDRREVMAALYGVDIARQMLEVASRDSDLQINGFISPPTLTRSNRREMNFFVNGRPVQDGSLIAALMRAYHTFLMTGRFPIATLFLEISSDQVDVNVHPTKAEVRFRDQERIFTGLQHAVRRALKAHSPVPGIDERLRWSPEQTFMPRERQSPMDWQMMEEALQQEENRSSEGEPPSTTVQPALPGPGAPILRLVGQIATAYLVAEGPDGLYLIDQHAAHERVLFERFLDQRTHQVPAQTLLEPATITLPPASARLLDQQLPILENLGFQVEPFGPQTFRVRAIPVLLGQIDPSAAVRVLVEDFEEDETPLQEEVEERIIARVCKRAAVKAGQLLTPEEQRNLLRDLEACQSPRTCPHGRPTMIHLSVDLLERQFGRRGAR